MRIGIFNPYLHSLGGGERVVTVMAEALKNKHDVDLITYDEIASELLERTFDVDLKGVGIRVLSKEIKSKFLVFTELMQRVKGLMGVGLALGRRFGDRFTAEYDLFINHEFLTYLPSYARRSIMMCMFPRRLVGATEGLSLFESVHNAYLSTLLRLLSVNFVDTYDVLVANSQYVKRWVKRFWGRDCIVIHPPVDVESFKPSRKENMIISVGRFFSGYHEKKHVEMIKTFKKMCDNGLAGWQYHLVGNAHREEIHKRYLKKVKTEATGYPVYVHTNAPIQELRALYGKSKIFWHATGFGEDENANPERFEHFGMSTVEAMSAGCVPVVIGRGGQVEIVRPGVDGYLWTTLDQLQKLSWHLIRNEDERMRLSVQAIERSRLFSKERFELSIKQLIEQICA